MSRFKELERIERAIDNGVESELHWAVGYCELRLEMAQMKQHETTWRGLLARVRKKMEGDP